MLSPGSHPYPADQRPFALAAGLVCVAILLGGGGVAYAVNNAIVQLTALAVIAASFTTFQTFRKLAPWQMHWLIIASILLPMIQLVPVPPAVWQSLPGRDLIIEALLVAEIEPGWRAISVDSSRTRIAVMALIVPSAIIALSYGLSRARLQLLGWVIVAMGCVNLILGIPQVLSAGTMAIPYPENPMPGVLFGSFANRNSTSIFLVACLILATQLDVPRFALNWAVWFRGLLGLVLLIAIILTQSRTGIALCILPLGLTLFRVAANHRRKELPKSLFGGAVAAVSALVAAALLLIPGTRIETAFNRFFSGDGFRSNIWEDALYSADRFWPIGSGMGTFDEVFQIDESLEHLSPRTAGRAHNDYLEIVIEGGLPAIVILVAWTTWIVWLAWRARLSPDRWIAWSGGAILIAICAQSVTDYPLRNLAMLSVASVAVVLLARFSIASPRVRT